MRDLALVAQCARHKEEDIAGWRKQWPFSRQGHSFGK